MKHHTLDVYGVELFLVTSEKQWRKLRKRLPFMDRKAGAAGATQFAVWQPNGGLPVGHLVLFVDTKLHATTGELVDTIAHEAAHGAGQVLDWTRHDKRTGLDEPHAYLVGWLTRWVWDNVDRTNLAA